MSGDYCERCGAFGDLPHEWIDDDCVLPAHNYAKAHPPRATIGHVCVRCVDRWRDWLREIPELWVALPQVLEPGSVPDDTASHKRTRRSASPAPMRLSAWALLHPGLVNTLIHDPQQPGRMVYTGTSGVPDVVTLLANWTEAVFQARGWTGTPPDTVSGCTVALSAAVEVLACTPDVDEFDADLGWIRRSLRSAHALSEPAPLGRCITVTDGRDCGGQVWPDRGGDGRPQCRRCRRRYGPLDLVRLQAMAAREGTA